MASMFNWASGFDRDLGWCVDDDVILSYAFYNAKCESTSCGVKQVAGGCAPTPAPTVSPLVADDTTIRTAVTAWLSDSAAAEAKYGHISTWETSGVTDMSYLFCQKTQVGGTVGTICHSDAASFNEDIGKWDTSGVTSMYYMFRSASAFNQDISDWSVDSVTSMRLMFYSASAFNQDLGWCVDDDVDLEDAFGPSRPKEWAPQCAPTSCGVVRCPTKKKEQTPVAIIAGAAAGAALLLLVVGAFYRRRKASMTDKADEPSEGNPEPTELSAPEEATTPNEEDATIPVAPEGEEASTEQPPPPPRRWFSRAEPEPDPPKAEEMYNQIAAWYNEPENAALRATWGAYPEPDGFQIWPGFVAVTNAFLDREAG